MTLEDLKRDKRMKRLLMHEVKKLREQLAVAIQRGNKLSATGVPLMTRRPNPRISDYAKDFSKANNDWWQFVAAAMSKEKK